MSLAVYVELAYSQLYTVQARGKVKITEGRYSSKKKYIKIYNREFKVARRLVNENVKTTIGLLSKT